MFSISTRLRLKNLLDRISNGEAVSLKDRLYLSKFADQNQTISNCLRRAQLTQQKANPTNSIDHLLNDLDLTPSDPEATFKNNQDDLGEWFCGAPSWIGRS